MYILRNYQKDANSLQCIKGTVIQISKTPKHFMHGMLKTDEVIENKYFII